MQDIEISMESLDNVPQLFGRADYSGTLNWLTIAYANTFYFYDSNVPIDPNVWLQELVSGKRTSVYLL